MTKCTFLSTSPICKSTLCFRLRSLGVSTNHLRSQAHQPPCGLPARSAKLPHSFWVGIFLILVAGVMAGDSMLSLEFNRKWGWENTWLVFMRVRSLFMRYSQSCTVCAVKEAYQRITEIRCNAYTKFTTGLQCKAAPEKLSESKIVMSARFCRVRGRAALTGRRRI